MNQEKVWDSVAEKWKDFKKKQYFDFRKFMRGKKGNVLDLGCGSGRNFIHVDGTIYAVDFSSKMLELAREYAEKKKIKVITKKAQADNLPFKDNFFDVAIFIATLHCIKGKEKREKSLRELYRVMKSEAEAIITVWSRKQKRIKNKSKESYIPWTVDGKKYYRYTYIYKKSELQALLKKVGFKILEIKEEENIVVFVKK